MEIRQRRRGTFVVTLRAIRAKQTVYHLDASPGPTVVCRKLQLWVIALGCASVPAPCFTAAAATVPCLAAAFVLLL